MSLRRPQLTHLHPSVHPSTATAPTVGQTQTSEEEAESALLDLLCLLNHPQAVLLSCDSVFCVSCMSEPCSCCIPEDQYDDSKAHLDVKPVDCWLPARLSLKYTQLFSMTQNEWLMNTSGKCLQRSKVRELFFTDVCQRGSLPAAT